MCLSDKLITFFHNNRRKAIQKLKGKIQMMNNHFRCMALRGLSLFTAAALLTACAASQAAAPATSESTADEAVTFMAPYLNVEAFIDKVHSIYPEVNIEIVPYSGDNTTSCIQNMIEAHDLPDICTVTVYNPMTDDMSDQLIDLAGYDFTDNYIESRLQEVTDNGAIYLLPSVYNCYGITYNKTLLQQTAGQYPPALPSWNSLPKRLRLQVWRSAYRRASTRLWVPVYVQHCGRRLSRYAGRQTLAEGLPVRQGQCQRHAGYDGDHGVYPEMAGHRYAER